MDLSRPWSQIDALRLSGIAVDIIVRAGLQPEPGRALNRSRRDRDRLRAREVPPSLYPLTPRYVSEHARARI